MNKKKVAACFYDNRLSTKNLVIGIANILTNEGISVSVNFQCSPFRIITPNTEILCICNADGADKLLGRRFDEIMHFPDNHIIYTRLSENSTHWSGSLIDYVKKVEGVILDECAV